MTQVLVVGAGPTGLVLALSLARTGVPVRVVETRPGVARESRALDVQARTLEHYRQLGVVDGLLERGVRVRRVAVRVGGRQVSATDVTGFGRGLSRYPFILCCPQDEHEALLVDALAAAGVAVEWGTRLSALADLGERMQVTLTGPTGAPEVAEVAYLAGADGAHSTVRELAGVDFSGDTSEQTYFVADVRATGDAHGAAAEPGSFTFCLSAEDFMLVVPARRGGTQRVIGLLPSTLPGSGPPTFAALRATLETTTGLVGTTENWFSTYRVSHRLAERFRVGRVFLLGDAAHLHSPLGGQGMNTGVADAVDLGWKLAAVLQHRAGPGLLDTYGPERLRFARSLVATTDRLFRLVDGPGGGHRLARSLLFRWLLPAALAVPPVRTWLCARIGQVQAEHRPSTLSSGRAGRVRGGDRLPWVELPGGGDTHEPLAARDWQLQVHGSLRPELGAAAAERGVAVHVVPWTARSRAAGLRRDAAYLVRPDGYVALADPAQRVQRLAAALDRFRIRGRQGTVPTG